MKTFTMRVLGVVAAISLLGLVMAYLAGFFESKIVTEPVDAKHANVSGDIITVETVNEPIIEQATGTIRAKNETVISARIMATIASLNVRAGDTVEAGDVLATLDSRELEARLDQQQEAVAAARARLSEAESNYNRVAPLVAKGVATQAEFDRAEAALSTAQAELAGAMRATDEANTALSYTTLTAPFAGRVIDRFADPGDTAIAGTPLLRIYDPEQLRLEANVRESLASRLERGQPLVARIDALDQQFEVTVDEIVPSADPGSRSFVVKVNLPTRPNLYPGMFGRLLIRTGRRETLYVPQQAIAQFGQLNFVHLVTDQGVVRRYIRTGRAAKDQVEVLSGLKPGEKIVAKSKDDDAG